MLPFKSYWVLAAVKFRMNNVLYGKDFHSDLCTALPVLTMRVYSFCVRSRFSGRAEVCLLKREVYTQAQKKREEKWERSQGRGVLVFYLGMTISELKIGIVLWWAKQRGTLDRLLRQAAHKMAALPSGQHWSCPQLLPTPRDESLKCWQLRLSEGLCFVCFSFIIYHFPQGGDQVGMWGEK